MAGNKRSGPRPILSAEQAAELRQWHADVQALGTAKGAARAAIDNWRKARRALGYMKQKSRHYDVAVNTIRDYARGRHKVWPGSDVSSGTGLRGRANGTARADGTGNHARGATADAKSMSAAKSTNGLSRPSVRNV